MSAVNMKELMDIRILKKDRALIAPKGKHGKSNQAYIILVL